MIRSTLNHKITVTALPGMGYRPDEIAIQFANAVKLSSFHISSDDAEQLIAMIRQAVEESRKPRPTHGDG